MDIIVAKSLTNEQKHSLCPHEAIPKLILIVMVAACLAVHMPNCMTVNINIKLYLVLVHAVLF